MLTKRLTEVLDRYAPIKTFQVWKKYVPWLSEPLKLKMKKRDAAQEEAAVSGRIEDWHNYTNLRNTCTRLKKREKKKWEKSKLENTGTDSSAMWGTIKTWLGWGNSRPQNKLFDNGKTINSPVELANTMNSFFVNKIKTLKKKIPESSDDPCETLKNAFKDVT